jgi:hypothetical protein
MWESFFGFRKTPFSDSPDAKQLSGRPPPRRARWQSASTPGRYTYSSRWSPADHLVRLASASIDAFKVQNAFIRRADFGVELCDEICQFHRRIDDSKCVLSAFLQHVQICKVCRNGSTTHEVGEPYECDDNSLSGYVLSVSGLLKFSRPTSILIKMNSPQLIPCEFVSLDCGVRFRFKY